MDHDAYQYGVYQACKSILNSLEKDGFSRVILVGEAGIGKTWMAREICELATRRGSCYIAIWLNLNKELDEMLLYESIASQLSLFPENEGSEEDDSDDDHSEDEEEQKSQDLTRLKDQIHKKIRKKKLKYRGKMYTLLVLDDEGSVTSEEKVMKDLYLGDFFAPYGSLKILLTRRNGEKDAIDAMDEIVCSRMELDVPPTGEPHASIDESRALFDSRTIDKSKTFRDILTDDFLEDYLENSLEINGYELLKSLEEACGKDNGFLLRRIAKMSMRLTAAAVVLAKSIICISQKRPFSLSPKQEEVFKIAVLSSFSPDTTGMSRRNPILHLAYELLETDDTMESSIVDCFWHCLTFFEHCGCVYYQELIAHWILEGYFDPVRSVTKAYKDGHAILMELMNRGFLKVHEDNVVMPEVAMKNVIDLRRRGLSGTSRIGLAKVCGSDMTKGLGKINQVDDVIKGVRATTKREKITTILVSGNRLRRETPEKFFEKLKDLEILGLFEPTLAPYVPSLLKLMKLRVLVIRNCDLLKDIEELKGLQGLHVLEVSGASSVKEISDDFFKAMSDLQSLHLSGLQITSSPSSISKLTELRCLIIKDCSLLEDLPDIQELVNLEVVDISGARGLQTCFDKAKGERRNKNKNKNFYHLTKLQLIDFSESQIERLPIFQDADVVAKFHSLARLLLRNCRKLIKLPNLKPLSGLQILDLSGTTSLVKMVDVCFEDKKELRILNLSGSNLRHLPSTIEELSNLNELLLRDCTNLEALSNIEKLTNLEVFDVSGCAKLHRIEGSFVDMSYLREINLSGTKVMIPPELPMESKLYGRKRIILADKRPFEGENWNEVKKALQREISENASSSDAVIKSQEISAKESGEIQPNEPGSNEFPGKRGISRQCFRQFPVYRALYQKSIPFFDSESHPKVLEIHGCNGLSGPRDLDEEAIASAEFVTFVDSSSRSFTSVFNKIRSVKGCWLKMCDDIRYLFSDVEEERLGSLATLLITNLPSLESIGWGGSFKNMKNLRIDCCPNIKTLFPEASQLPSLEVLHIKFCEKLEKVFEKEGEVSTLTTLCLFELPVLSVVGAELPNLETYKVRNCPELNFQASAIRAGLL